MPTTIPRSEDRLELSPQERRDRLVQAAERYMRGEIDVSEYERAEDLYLPDYRGFALTLAKAQLGDRPRVQEEEPVRRVKRIRVAPDRVRPRQRRRLLSFWPWRR